VFFIYFSVFVYFPVCVDNHQDIYEFSCVYCNTNRENRVSIIGKVNAPSLFVELLTTCRGPLLPHSKIATASPQTRLEGLIRLSYPRRCRGKGVVPRRIAFHELIESYRSQQRSKEEHSRQLELQAHLATIEARMAEIIDRRVALALRKQVAASSGANVDIIPSQLKSSVSFMEATLASTKATRPSCCIFLLV
jgi:hypothetical protein